MQSKISAFFKPRPTAHSSLPSTSGGTADQSPILEDLSDIYAQEPEVVVKYQRRAREPPHSESNGTSAGESSKKLDFKFTVANPGLVECGKPLNKKRKYAQFHLDLGQSDYWFHACATCGFKYAPGDELDENVHKTFHKNYAQGIPFKGWRNTRIICVPSVEAGHVVLVLDDDPLAHRNKVQEVIKMMEMELGDGWILHPNSKVYLYVLSQRIAGCVVAESIEKANKVMSSSTGESNIPREKDARQNTSILEFGGVSFKREKAKTKPPEISSDLFDDSLCGVTLCENETVPACCGIRAIWVTPSNRRKHIASHLLDAVRMTFCKGLTIDHSGLAFSQPTSLGKALISSYTGSSSFLVYTTT